MTCKEYWDLMGLDRQGDGLTEEQYDAMEAHLKSCADCRSKVKKGRNDDLVQTV